ncbi:uncharacterized protein LOC127086203 isoform X2 [Lathyrus oleraceus]|uniref:uncharacterized protein LOC127086203 isoform X2 n=1 Tax=Pisum sativum TaxID=3888 RepID=UPI0021D3CF3C|nr:uncharacterized protein LOC127086203 isoform X2 [Pisum sativum]
MKTLTSNAFTLNHTNLFPKLSTKSRQHSTHNKQEIIRTGRIHMVKQWSTLSLKVQGKNQFSIIDYHPHMSVLSYRVKGNGIILMLTGYADSKAIVVLDPGVINELENLASYQVVRGNFRWISWGPKVLVAADALQGVVTIMMCFGNDHYASYVGGAFGNMVLTALLCLRSKMS